MKRKAFMLIELLVVMAFIAILVSILYPVFARARDAARHRNDKDKKPLITQSSRPSVSSRSAEFRVETKHIETEAGRTKYLLEVMENNEKKAYKVDGFRLYVKFQDGQTYRVKFLPGDKNCDGIVVEIEQE